MTNTEYHIRKPQQDIPTENIIHYIVKDYRRMFLTYDEMKSRAEKAEAKIVELKEKHHSLILKKKKEIEELKNSRLQDMNHVKDLEEKLAFTRKQNNMLVHADLTKNNGMGLIALQALVPIDPKELEKKIGIQLGDALIKLYATEELLSNYKGLLEEAIAQGKDNEYINNSLTKATKAFGKIVSAVTHIENFYKLVNGVPLT